MAAGTKGEDTRSTVLGSALSLATQLGLEGVTIGKLAEHVGMSKSGLFAHFASKENLQLAILDEAAARFVALVVAPALKKPRGEPRVRALVDNWLAWSKQDFMPGGCIFVVAGVELDDRPGPARDRLVASQKDWLSTLAGAARIAVEEKHFRKDLDTEQLAHEMYSIAIGYHFLRRIGDPARAERRARTAFERLWTDARAT
ncbi:MAG: Transcriptional regulator, TetR family [Labilithrix sp.]|nr:Transcriptional regulator, TetR family [Labilithrix sp.]